VTWDSEITGVNDGVSFEDTQLAGPFAEWVHTHSFQPASAGCSRLDDQVRYALPFGVVGRLFGAGFVRSKLERMFAYRHRITGDDLLRHSRSHLPAMRILITGSTGMVGSALIPFLTTGGHQVRRLVRHTPRSNDEFHWDTDSGTIDPAALEGIDAVVHLAGENIAGRRWSTQQKERILRSRREGTRQIVDAIQSARTKPRVLVSASAIGIYGSRGDEVLTEESSQGSGYLAEVCGEWESSAGALSDVRTVQLRFGVILGAAGGALKKMLLPFKLGGGGRIGSGQQWMSWIGLDDAIGAIHHALTTEDLSGAVNAVAPKPVTNSEYTRTLGRVLARPTVFPMPAFAARMAFGELADELLLASQRVQPTKLQASGYRFGYPALEDALRHQLGR